MGKVLKAVGIGVLMIGAGLLTGGTGFLGIAALTKGTLIAAGVASMLGGLATLAFAPKMPKTQLSRLNATLDPSTPRKMVFGTTAMPLDIRYHEASGTNQEYIDYIIALSAHKIKSIDAIWFEDKLAWSLAGGVTSRYSRYLTVNVRLEGTAANYIPINGGAKWGSDDRLTGCAYIHLRVKRTGNTDKAESPLVNGLPSRVTVIGEGGHLYDPRKDSTVSGGSGTHRANDQSTWGTYTDPDDVDNPALQLLWYLIGWKINGKLSVGCGVPISRIDLPSFITAANICDENITLAIGGTQKRYRASGTASDSDDRMEIINTFLASMNGTLRDNEGKLTLTVMKNDLADYVLTFDENDVLDAFEWNQTRGLDTSFNVARGRYVDPSNNSLYQLTEYPEVRLASPDGIDRVLSLDFAFVEDGRRAQRLAKQVLQRNQYRGTFNAVFTAKALGCQVGDVVRLTFGTLGWTNKLFRVISQQIDFSGQVPLTLVEENAAIYAWDAEDQAPIEATAPTVYDPLNNPFILGISDVAAIADGKIVTFFQASQPVANGIGDIWFDTDDANKMYRWSGTAWVLARDTGITSAISAASDAQATADGKVNTYFQASAPTPEAVGDLWFETDANNALWRWNGSNWVLATDTRVTAAIGSSGIINTDKVVTDSINAGAVSSLITSYSTSSVSTTTDDTYLAIQSAQITAAGGSPISVDGCFNLKVQIGPSVTQPRRIGVTLLMLWQDNLGNSGSILNNVIVDYVIYNSINQVWQMVPFAAVHAAPVSGRTYTYTIYAKYQDGGTGDVLGMQSFVHRFMRIQELKR